MTTFFALIEASPAAYAACFAAILVSSATHRVTGQAFGLICAPLIALAAPTHVPALILLCGLPVMVYSFRGDWDEIRWGEISYAFAGRVVGAVLAAYLIAAVADKDIVSVCVGVAVLLGVGISLTNFAVAINPVSLLAAGFLSGAMATLTSVGAPPMGLLYQRKSFGHVRATLNAFFLFGGLASVGALMLYGLIKLSDVSLTFALVPRHLARRAVGRRRAQAHDHTVAAAFHPGHFDVRRRHPPFADAVVTRKPEYRGGVNYPAPSNPDGLLPFQPLRVGGIPSVEHCAPVQGEQCQRLQQVWYDQHQADAEEGRQREPKNQLGHDRSLPKISAVEHGGAVRLDTEQLASKALRESKYPVGIRR